MTGIEIQPWKKEYYRSISINQRLRIYGLSRRWQPIRKQCVIPANPAMPCCFCKTSGKNGMNYGLIIRIRGFTDTSQPGKAGRLWGDVSYFYDEQQEIWLAAISICAKYRGQGYESAALRLLCATAREAGIPEKDIKNWNFVK